MDAILQMTNERLLPVLEQWDGVDAIVVLRFGTDRYDPSFFISYDIYYDGDLPAKDQREAALAVAAGFETTQDGQKDRILVDDVPVRLEYKDKSSFDAALAAARDGQPSDVLISTYGFFRMQHGRVLLERSNWLKASRTALEAVPESFWTWRIDALRARMDHVLADLSSAVFAGEDLFYYLSLASFLSTLSSLLFAINRRFEPAGRLLNEHLQQLPVLPEGFPTRLEYLLRSDSTVTDKMKREIAELITRSVLRLA